MTNHGISGDQTNGQKDIFNWAAFCRSCLRLFAGATAGEEASSRKTGVNSRSWSRSSPTRAVSPSSTKMT